MHSRKKQTMSQDTVFYAIVNQLTLTLMWDHKASTSNSFAYYNAAVIALRLENSESFFKTLFQLQGKQKII